MLIALALAAALSTDLPSGPELEVLFWDCDYATTQSIMGSSDAAVCSQVFEKVKAEKFKGKYPDLLVWWKKTKTFEYARRAKNAKDS